MKRKASIKNDDILQRNSSDVMMTEVDDEMVLMNVKTGKYLGLNEVGASIWKHLENEITFDDLVNRLLEEYEVDESNCRNDSMAFVVKLNNIKLITKK